MKMMSMNPLGCMQITMQIPRRAGDTQILFFSIKLAKVGTAAMMAGANLFKASHR